MNKVEIKTPEVFNDEEKQVINQLAEGTGYRANREQMLKAAQNLRSLADEGDADFTALLDGLYAKLNTVTGEEWETLKGYLPFPVNIAATEDYADGEIPDTEE